MPDIAYKPDGATLSAFLKSDAAARFICGPFGSGKTVACCVELFRRACQQAPGKDGVRRTRWMIVRSTYPQLKRTTIPTWRDWFDDRFGRFHWGPPPRHHIVLPLGDGTILDMDNTFVALDGPDAEADLRGFEGTGIFFNEMREIPKSVVDFGRGRVGRYPAKKDGGASWYGIIGDTNPPDTDSWYFRFAEEERPEGWEFYKQPGGVVKEDHLWVPNPDAENMKFLPDGYYENQISGQDEDWIKVFLAGEYGYAVDGKVVYPEWRDSSHVAPHPLEPIEQLPLYIGLDFGLTPAAIFGQRTASGQWRIIDELVATDMGVVRFSEQLASYISVHYPNLAIESWGDPAGNARAQTDERTCIQIVREYAGIPCVASPSNDWTLRREAVAGALNRMVDGEPGLLVSPTCSMLRKGFAGGYCFRRVQVAGDERYRDKVDKNAYSHPHDALQYLLSGGGEARVVMRKQQRRNAHMRAPRTDSKYSPLSYGIGR